MSKTVWCGSGFPKVGIRPVIDGRRRGVRESLETQTMNMAESAARLISAGLKYPDGTPVRCVIADTTIGGCAEAAACAAKFERENVGVSLTVTPCWCYGTETMDDNPYLPKAVWGFNGTERPGAVYLAAMLAGYAQKGLPAYGIYGRDVQDRSDTTIPADVREKLLRFAKSGLAAAMMRGKSYLSLGSSSMGIAGSFVDYDFFQEYLGMRTENVDMCEFDRRITEGIYDREEYGKALAWVKKHCREGKDYNRKALRKTRAAKDADWEYVVKMALVGRDLMVGNPKLDEMGYGEEALGRNAVAAGFQGQRQWTDYKPNGDFMEAVLNSSFDWNGIRAPYIMATENDSLNGVCMLLMYLLTNRAQIFADVRTYWSPDAVKRVTGKRMTGRNANGFIHLLNSGAACLDGCGKQREKGKPAMKPFWEITPKEADACMRAVEWDPANVEYFRGGGYSSSFLSEGGMPMTMTRVSIVKGLGPVLQIAEGWSTALPAGVSEALMARTDPNWPCTWFVPRLTGTGAFSDVYSVMNNWSANHGAISFGHIGADLTTLAAMLRIPVAMSNVPAESVFRPHVWGLLGADDPTGADYRACRLFGPVYG
ncbi:MAG: L-fucose isomerase [Kiritimatiellae bacterium]|nr:L-fucose isomerase [Kiritimatiellia bacterium]MDD3543896.1 L-fucose isomerase [Kiritimatiellia bacterium]